METYERYIAWLKSNGCIFKHLEPCGEGYPHLRASQNIEPLKAFLFVNNTVIISAERARNSDLRELLSEALFMEHEEADNFTLYAFLMWEKLKGEASFWHLYFETAGMDDLLMFWTDRQMDELQDHDLKWDAGTMRQDYERHWEYVYGVLKFSKEFESYDENSLKEVFKWAYCMVASRGFSSGLPTPMLIPLADNLNHTNVHVSIDLYQSNEINTTKFGVDFSDFTNEAYEPQHTKMMVNRTFKNRLQKYTDLRKVRKLENIWELDNILRRYQSSTDQEDNDTSSSSSSEESPSEPSDPEEEQEEEESSEEESEEEEEKEPKIRDHEWYSWDLTEAFVSLRTGQKTSYAKGKEVFYTYGKRPNSFLLMHYGFSLPFNVYDSIKVKVWADRGEEAKQLQKSTATTEYRFKRHKLNEMALEFYRIKVLRNAPPFKF